MTDRSRSRVAVGRRCGALFIASCLAWLLVAGAAESDEAPGPGQVADDETVSAAEEPKRDPWEKYNRGMFAFNEFIDIYGLAPVAKGWRWIVPDPVETGVRNFFDNIDMPIIMANHILQAKPAMAAEDLARIIYNTTAGVGGFIDVATILEIPDNQTDFGLTFARWGAPAGPYFMLPLWGPSTVRDTFGVGALFAANPYGYFIPFWGSFLTRGIQVINTRAYYLDEVAAERQAALDFYVFMRDAYLQNRIYQVREVRGEDPYQSSGEDFYFDEFEEEELYFYDDEGEEGASESPVAE